MSAKFNKLTLLSVGVAGLGLLGCGAKDKPVDSVTARQAIVGNTRSIAADFSRTAKFLEVSSMLQNGVGFASRADVTICTATPDGTATSCETDPIDESADATLDLDINDATDELLAELERRVLADANVETTEAREVTYLLRGSVVCAVDGEPLDQECVKAYDDAEIRLVVTSPADGDVDVDVLIGPNRANPLSLEIHQDLLALEADLGGIKDSAAHLSVVFGEELELPSTFEGRVRLEVSAPSDHEFGAAISVLQAIKVADGDFSFAVGQSLPLYAVTLDSTAKTLLGEANVGAIDGSFPVTSASADSNGVETSTSFDLGFHLAGLTGTTLLDVANEVVTMTGMGLGPDSTVVTVDGQTVATLDLNPDSGRTLDATMTVDADDAVRISVTPKFDLRLALQMANAMAAIDDIDDWMLDEVLSITLDGAASPTVRVGDELAEVVEGTLTMSMQNAGLTHTVAAGQCLLDAAGDAPTVDGDGTEPTPIDETSTNPMDDFVVGACQ